MQKLLKEMIGFLDNGYSCIIAKGHRITHKLNGVGVSPIRLTYIDHKESLKNAIIVDKVIGKAASVLCVLAGVFYVYGDVMSETAVLYLKENGIKFQYKQLVPMIENRTKTGMCPLEESVIQINDPIKAYDSMNKTIEKLMKNK